MDTSIAVRKSSDIVEEREPVQKGPVFRVGDVVTRDGTDEHLVLTPGEQGDIMDIVCIKEPLGYLDADGERREPWTHLGEFEYNLVRRYAMVRPATRDSIFRALGWLPAMRKARGRA